MVLSSGYISQPVDTQSNILASGRATYQFLVPETASYTIQALVNAPSIGSNSFFVNVDADPTDPVMIWDVTLTNGFESRFISWRGDGTSDADQFSPKAFDLSAGVHQLIILGREANVRIQSFQILKLPAPPTGFRVVPGS
jgi:hypothetical protein